MMAPPPPPLLSFTVRRREAVLVGPAGPTPREVKPLSDIDDQEGLRFQTKMIHYYREDPSRRGQDPAEVIKEALSRALVFYYPFAGRIREGPGRKLVVECTGEGVIFTEADASVRLDQLGDGLPPPVPLLADLLYDVPGSSGIVGCPLLLIQVTRLMCGGFIFALRMNHTMSDAAGLVQFLTAVGDLARGATSPATPPIWDRHLLSARLAPRISYPHHEFNPPAGPPFPSATLSYRSFFFTRREFATLESLVGRKVGTTFEVLSAAVWRSRTLALRLDPSDPIRLMRLVNARARLEPNVPAGYYGNAFGFGVAETVAGELGRRPLRFAVELVRSAKYGVTDDYLRSMMDMMTVRGRPHFCTKGTYLVPDATYSGFRDVDFGWGQAAYGGPAVGGFEKLPGVCSFFLRYRDAAGEDGIVVPICLPAGETIDRFVEEMEKLVGAPLRDLHGDRHAFLLSSL